VLTLGSAAVDTEDERLLAKVPLIWRTAEICHSSVDKKNVDGIDQGCMKGGCGDGGCQV
jgi:hypothetical protein